LNLPTMIVRLVFKWKGCVAERELDRDDKALKCWPKTAPDGKQVDGAASASRVTRTAGSIYSSARWTSTSARAADGGTLCGGCALYASRCDNLLPF